MQAQLEVDKRETRIRSLHETTKAERAASAENKRSSTLVPKLNLNKVKGYEEHLRDKQASKGKETKNLPKQMVQTTSQPISFKQGVEPKQMQTIQHHSTKMNNFMGSEVNLSNHVIGSKNQHHLQTAAGGQHQ